MASTNEQRNTKQNEMKRNRTERNGTEKQQQKIAETETEIPNEYTNT